jgi:hypothetical protein
MPYSTAHFEQGANSLQQGDPLILKAWQNGGLDKRMEKASSTNYLSSCRLTSRLGLPHATK